MGANNSTTLGFKYLQQVSLFYVCKPEAPVPRINNTTTTQSLFTIPGSKNPRLLHARFYPLVRQGEGKKELFRPRPKVVVFNRHTDVLHTPQKCESPEKIPVQVKHWKGTIPGRKRRGRVYVQREAQPKALSSFTEPNKANVFKMKSPEKKTKKQRNPTSI